VNRKALAAAAAIVVLAAALGFALSPGLRAELQEVVGLAARGDAHPLREYMLRFGWKAPAVSALLQILTSVIPPLPSFAVGIANGMVFGLWWGAALTWTTALAAAALCFAIARGLGRPTAERLLPEAMLATADRFFARHGVLAVLFGRLVPFINPDILSYAAGLTSMRWRLFLASIAAGSIPSVILHAWVGSRGLTAIGWLLVVAAAVGVLMLLVAYLRRPPPTRGTARDLPRVGPADDRTDRHDQYE
jgi:uncharacterized membrane protein YdjX (TVP38/TMEM64 family)